MRHIFSGFLLSLSLAVFAPTALADTLVVTSDQPSFTLGQVLWANAATITGGLIALVLILWNVWRKTVAEVEIPSTIKRTPKFDDTLLTTMFHTARLSGDISQRTLQTLIKTYKTLTGHTVKRSMINAKYALKTDTDELLSIMPQLAGLERDTIMKACTDVAAADGTINKEEHDFLMALFNALDLDSAMFPNQIREDMRAPRRSQLIIAPTAA